MTFWKSVAAGCAGEARKIRAQRRYLGFLIFWGVFVVLRGLFTLVATSILNYYGGNLPYEVLSMAEVFFCPMAIFLLTADLLSGEMEHGTIKLLLVRPATRHAVLLSKFLSILRYCGVMLLEGLLLSFVFEWIQTGFDATHMLRVILAYLLTLLPLAAVAAVAVCIGSCVRSSVTCFLLCLLVYGAFLAVGVLFSLVSPLLFTTYLNLGALVAGSSVPVVNLLTGAGMLLGYTLLFLSAAEKLFAAKDF